MTYNFNCFFFTLSSWIDGFKNLFVKRDLPGPVVLNNKHDYFDFKVLRNNTKLLNKHKNLDKSSDSLYYSCVE